MLRADLLYPSHFHSAILVLFRSWRSHCGSTGEQFVLIRTVLNETGEQSAVAINFHSGEEKRRDFALSFIIA